MAEDDNLTHAEVWDDRELQSQWNDALEEYKKYHSINARGEDVAKVLKEAAEAERQSEQDDHLKAANGTMEIMSDAKIANVPHVIDENGNQGTIHHYSADVGAEGNSKSVPALAMPPASITQSIHDKDLKNLMMSWYWAGYYTGFYEGQRNATQGQHSNGS